jgi:hypothetical protein
MKISRYTPLETWKSSKLLSAESEWRRSAYLIADSVTDTYCRRSQAIGSLAAAPPQPNALLSGLLVAKDYSYTLLSPNDLRDFAGLATCVVTQRQSVALNIGWELLRWHLEGLFGRVEDGLDDVGVPTLRV